MNDEEWIADVCTLVRESVRKRLGQLSLREMASLDRVEALVRALLSALAVGPRRRSAFGPTVVTTCRVRGGPRTSRARATLRFIIDEGDWLRFRADYLSHAASTFEPKLALRLERAKNEGRLSDAQVDAILGRQTTKQGKAA
jgi:hypothetical protein